ncbi:hypothetical protein M758_10G103700 [Ceratodon purpureus]|nr:hypothetical protein M758_10G103700 [Ceratodon purpureus]
MGADMASGKTVCVTGANGFIASWLVKLLLERGYTVKGTIRNAEKSKHLLNLPGASERLQLIEADLLKPGAFDSAVQGCDGVFHTASPFFYNVTDPDAELLDPAVKGTLNVLESCAKARTKKIVLTSSVAAVAYTPKRIGASVVDESFFSDIDLCRKEQRWYVLSKTLAELAAWDFVKEHNLNMVAVNPTMVLGPLLQASMNSSNELLLEYLNGTSKSFPNLAVGWVGVEDVALAHLLVYENPKSEGRYICNERVLHYGDFVSLLSKLYPQYPVLAKDADDSPRIPAHELSNEKLKNLGLTFRSLEEVVHETVACLKELKYLE